MTPYDMIRERISQTVPFAKHIGVELVSVEDGKGEARLVQSETTINHIGSLHAGALFTLGEAASGAAMAGALLPKLMQVRPVASSARVHFTKIAKGTITATGRTSLPSALLLETIEKDGKVSFEVEVELVDEMGEQVSNMTVEWHTKIAP